MTSDVFNYKHNYRSQINPYLKYATSFCGSHTYSRFFWFTLLVLHNLILIRNFLLDLSQGVHYCIQQASNRLSFFKHEFHTIVSHINSWFLYNSPFEFINIILWWAQIYLKKYLFHCYVSLPPQLSTIARLLNLATVVIDSS